MPRSASTFIWQMTYDLINYNHKQHKLKEYLPENLRTNFVYDVARKIETFDEAIPDDEFYLVKTHGDFHPQLKEYEKAGKVKIICTIRDPFDISVSWMDVHEKEKNQETKRPGFLEIDSLDKVVSVVKRDMKIAEEWLNSYNPLVFKYVDILGDHTNLINAIVDHLGLEIYLFDKVYSFYSSKSNITEFNKGIKGRGKQLRPKLSDKTINLFNDFIANYLE